MRARKSLQTGRQTNRIMPAVFRYRMLITFFVFLLAAGVFCGSVSAYDDIHYAQNLSDALNISYAGAAYASGDTVYLVHDVPLNYTINITASNSITLTIEGSASHTISRDFNSGYLFNVSSGTFILAGNSSSNLTIDGNKYESSFGNGASLICVDGGTFTMGAGSVLQNSDADYGGGVFVNSDGTFNMNGGDISNNNASVWGGGVFMNGGMFTMSGGNISDNNADFNGGGVYVDDGTFTMTGDSIISGNTAAIDSGLGGGVYVSSSGTFTMSGDSIISGNTAAINGGGVFVNSGMFTISGGNISTNNASTDGGGVFVNDGGTFNMTGGDISNNNASTDGGGVYVYDGLFNMTGGNISNNNASTDGAGVYVDTLGTFTMTGGNITNNTAVNDGSGVYVDCSGTFTMTGDSIISGNTAAIDGGGVFLNGGMFNMEGGNISDNTASTGGGVYLDNDGTFTMSGNSIISGNNAATNGGGVCVDYGTFTMTGDSIISGNNATTEDGLGGGVCVDYGTFTMTGDSIISGNNATTEDGLGGGVYVGSSGTFTMTGGNISNNTAEAGCGVLVNGGTFNMNGGDISNNNADSTYGGWGGGVCVYNTGTFNMTGGDISSNNASGWGGGVYVDSSTFTMTCGNISDNTARVQGNGVYVFNGMFTMIGGNISSNNASTDGGGVFVDRFGTFTMNCSAAVNTNNDVYLNSSRFITVTGVLSSTAGTRNITPEFTSGTVIRYNAGVSPGTWADNFALNQTWANDHPTLALGQSGSDILLGTNCTVTFWINSTTVYLSQYNVSGALLAQPADPSSSGYTFNGWNISSASGDPWDFTNDTITANLDLYAKWTPNFAPISPGSGGDNSNNNADSGHLSAGGAFTTNDGGLTLQYPAGTSAIITIFPNYLCGGISLPPNVSYLNLYDVYSTAQPGTPVTLVFTVDVLQLDELGVTSDHLTILHYIDGQWQRVEQIYKDGRITTIRDRLSPFMVAYNIDESLFPLEGAAASTSTPTTGPTQVEPTVVVPTTAPTKAASSPVPVLGIIAGVAGMALLIRRE